MLGLGASGVLLLAACSPAAGPAASAPPGGSATAQPAATCVADVDAVIARQPTAAMAGPLPADEAAALDAAAGAAFSSAASPGAVVAVRGPRGTWTKAYGVADKATNAPMTTDGYQRIGSVTKTFIGTLLLQLADDGKLSLDDPIDKYVPGVPNGATVTLRSLANMTSGVASYTLDEGWQKTFFGEPFKVWTPDELLRIGLALPARFPPGSDFDYSNTNTILFGKVIEKQAGQDLATVLRTRILEPLRLTATSFPGASPVLPGFNPSVFYDTRSDTTVVVATNSDIASGDCTLSPTLLDNPFGIACSDPAVRVFVGVSQALGHQFMPNPKNWTHRLRSCAHDGRAPSCTCTS